MKKFFVLLFAILLTLLTILVLINKKNYIKVLKIQSPLAIFVDYNQNFVFDEKEPIIINNVFYIDKTSDLTNFPKLKNLSEKEKLFLDYYANYTARNILNNKFIKLKNKNIMINNQNYTDLLLKSGYFFDNTISSQEKLINKVHSINFNEYYIYNKKSKRYHSLDCPEAYKIKNYKIIRKEEISKKLIPCRNCIVKEEYHNREQTVQKTKSAPTSYVGENITIFFLDLNQIMQPSKKCTTKACIALKNEINQAKESIDMALYGIDNQPEIFNSIINAQKSGVCVRAVFDFDKKNFNYYQDTKNIQKYIKIFNTDKEYDLNNKSSIMHNKFFIFDNKKVFTGSANITSTCLTGFNMNLSVLINSPAIAQIYKQEFEQMLNGNFHTYKKSFDKKEILLNKNTTIKILFSPQDMVITKEIIPMINKAKKYIYIPIFFITKKELIQPLIDAKTRGVDIKIINDATNAHTKYSIHKNLRQAGIKVKTENYAGKMHTKAIIIDDEYSLIGSMNFTNSGEKYNDENIIIIKNKDITKYLKEVFIYLWNKIPEKYEKYDPRAESTESIGSCFDNIDNDFDEKIDKEDEGCIIH